MKNELKNKSKKLVISFDFGIDKENTPENKVQTIPEPQHVKTVP